jgi:hypothetical protein
MEDIEYDVMDELYFVISYKDLQNALGISDGALKQVLQNLIQRDWVKCLKTIDQEVVAGEYDFDQFYQQYYYLATKAGLLAHNRR